MPVSPQVVTASSEKKAFLRGSLALDPPRAGHDRRAFRLSIAYRTSTRAKEMDDSIRAMFPDDDNDLGPFLGNLPPEILDVVVKNLSWFQRMTFAMVGKTCREAVERVANSRAVLTERERMRLQIRVIGPLAVAAMRGDVEALEWLIQQLDAKGVGWRARSEVYSYVAAKRGQLKSLQKLREKRCGWEVQTCMWAAKRGHLEVLQWARQNGFPWNVETCFHAAMEGHLEVLQWARQNGCPWNAETCRAAAKGGHLEVLQWARQNGCPWNAETCGWAARKGNLEVLQWARQNGCPWDKNTWKRAKSNCRAYLIKHGCPGAHR